MASEDPLTSTLAPSLAARASHLGADHARNERRTQVVAAICAVTLSAELAGGMVFRSVALTASGLHMAAHLMAMVVAAGADAVARRRAGDARFAFGTGKIGDLAGFANAMVMGMTAILIAVESVQRMWAPETVDFKSALPLAVAGLVVTLVCVWLLKPRGQAHMDLNISAAHLHLSADAVVGVLAISSLLAGQFLGWKWADPAAGLAGAALVAQFAVSLMRQTAGTLLDMNPSHELTADIRRRLEAEGERVTDLRLWRVGPGHHAALAVVESASPRDADAYRARLAGVAGLSHATIEVRGATACAQPGQV